MDGIWLMTKDNMMEGEAEKSCDNIIEARAEAIRTAIQGIDININLTSPLWSQGQGDLPSCEIVWCD